jgi:5-methyltetrahydrofolate--homocysteine methyltransferase
MNEIFEQLATFIIEGEDEKTPELVQKALDDGLNAKDILDNGLVIGMKEVGVRFKDGSMYMPEVLMSAKAMSDGQELLRPILAASNIKGAGKVLLGTVKGDLHDIGKNLVGMMMEGQGLEIINLGFNVDPEKFVAAIKEHKPDVVGMSSMLTTTMRFMGHTIKAIEEAGLRDSVKVIVGGAPLDAAFGKRIGADGYGYNAGDGAELAARLLAQN